MWTLIDRSKLMFVVSLLGLALFGPGEGFATPQEIKITPRNEERFFSIPKLFRGREVWCRLQGRRVQPGTLRSGRRGAFWRALERKSNIKRKVRELKTACETFQPTPPGPSQCSPPPGYIAVADEAALFSLSDATKNYFLCRDITLRAPRAPLFPNAQFTGVFDFNGKTIEGLKIDAADDLMVGLIRINNGVLKNLKLTNAEVHGAAFVGAVTGLNNGTIENITIEDSQVKARFIGAGAAIGLSMRPPQPSLAIKRVRGGNGEQLGAIGLQKQ